MQARSDTRRRGGLRVQAVYSIAALAKAANVSRHLLLRLLRSTRVELVRSGRALLVPACELEAKLPKLWKSIALAERERRTTL